MEWRAFNFFLAIAIHPWMKHQSHKNKGNDHKLKKLLIIKQTFLVSICTESSMESMYTDARWCQGVIGSRVSQNLKWKILTALSTEKTAVYESQLFSDWLREWREFSWPIKEQSKISQSHPGLLCFLSRKLLYHKFLEILALRNVVYIYSWW